MAIPTGKENLTRLRVGSPLRYIRPQADGYRVTHRSVNGSSKRQGGMTDAMNLYAKPPILVNANYRTLDSAEGVQLFDFFRNIGAQMFIAELTVGHSGFEKFVCRVQSGTKPAYTYLTDGLQVGVQLEVIPEFDSVTINFIKKWGPTVGLQKEFFLCIYEGLIALPEPQTHKYPAPPSFHTVEPETPEPPEHGGPFVWNTSFNWGETRDRYAYSPFTWRDSFVWG